jgi:hypothetical protein
VVGRKAVSNVRLPPGGEIADRTLPVSELGFSGPRALGPVHPTGKVRPMYRVTRFVDQVTRMVGDFETYHWVGIGALLIVVGLVCMRGFGSQKAY